MEVKEILDFYLVRLSKTKKSFTVWVKSFFFFGVAIIGVLS